MSIIVMQVMNGVLFLKDNFWSYALLFESVTVAVHLATIYALP